MIQTEIEIQTHSLEANILLINGQHCHEERPKNLNSDL